MLYCLINPSSKSKHGFKTWKQIEKYLIEDKIPYHPIITKSKEDILNVAKILTKDDEKKTIIIIGGDGTLNAFLNGMENTRGISLGYLPVGSGNDFARGMRITKNYKEELNLILHGRKKRYMHYGKVFYPSGRKTRFFVSCGIGYDAKVCHKADLSPVKKVLNLFNLGNLVYLAMGVRYLIQAETFSGSLFVDGETVLSGDEFLFASFHVLPYEGGGFKFCPDQHPEENKLHICVAKGIPKWKIPFIIPQALTGTHIYRKGVYQYRCDYAKIETSPLQYVHTDGETDHLYEGIQISLSDEKIAFLN